nr:GNAT family N-acetyltransferase [uncultured Alistipes sp.]
MTTIERAERNDLQQILDLQYLAYRSEAELLNDFRIPPLLQTLQELQAEFETGVMLKAIDGCRGRIVGSVRGHTDGRTLFIGKLIVGHQQRRKGIGTELLGSIEKEYPPMRTLHKP